MDKQNRVKPVAKYNDRYAMYEQKPKAEFLEKCLFLSKDEHNPAKFH